MSTLTDNIRAASTVQALVQLLKNRSYDEIRQRMYDNPPGSRAIGDSSTRTTKPAGPGDARSTRIMSAPASENLAR